VKTREEKIEAILEYQKSKKELSIKYLRVDMLPDDVMLKEKDLNDLAIELIEGTFIPSGDLTGYNCLHCSIYSECEECPYCTVLGRECTHPKSIFRKAKDRANEPATPSRNTKFYNKMLQIGKKLYEDLELY